MLWHFGNNWISTIRFTRIAFFFPPHPIPLVWPVFFCLRRKHVTSPLPQLHETQNLIRKKNWVEAVLKRISGFQNYTRYFTFFVCGSKRFSLSFRLSHFPFLGFPNLKVLSLLLHLQANRKCNDDEHSRNDKIRYKKEQSRELKQGVLKIRSITLSHHEEKGITRWR